MRQQGILSKKEDGTFDYKVINEWQLCPKCSGVGSYINNEIWNYQTTISTAPVTCNVCWGKMIISKVNGLPPGP